MSCHPKSVSLKFQVTLNASMLFLFTAVRPLSSTITVVLLKGAPLTSTVPDPITKVLLDSVFWSLWISGRTEFQVSSKFMFR